MLILCDMDGVLVDLMAGWLHAYNRDYNDTLGKDKILSWELHHYVKPECGQKIYNYLSQPNFFFGLAPLPGALEGLTKLKEAGHDIVICTAPGGAESATDKIYWLQKYLPWINIKDVIIAHRKDLVKADILIDDSPINLVSYRDAFPRAVTITFDYPYNQKTVVDFRAHNTPSGEMGWESVVGYVKNLQRYYDSIKDRK